MEISSTSTSYEFKLEMLAWFGCIKKLLLQHIWSIDVTSRVAAHLIVLTLWQKTISHSAVLVTMPKCWTARHIAREIVLVCLNSHRM